MIKNQRPVSPYLEIQVKSADQGKLILMLYDGAIRCLDRGKNKILEKKFEDKHRHLSGAQDIIFELMEGLNLEAGDIAKHLLRIYQYMIRRIMDASLSSNVSTVEEVITLLKNLRDGWNQVLAKPAGETGKGDDELQKLRLSIRT